MIEDDSHYALLTQVALMYYEHEMTQQAIAREIGVSRVKVHRLLKTAREEGAVEIKINWRLNRDVALETRLRETFGLKEALVLSAPPHDAYPVLSNLGRLVAQYLEQVLEGGTSLAVLLGRTTFEVIEAIRPSFTAEIKVIQAIGSMPVAMQETDSSELVRQLGRKLGAEVAYLSAPPLADNADAARVFRSQRSIQSTLQAAREADFALVGVGNLQPEATSFVRAGFLASEDMLALAEEGAVGEMGGWTYNLDGSVHPNSLTERLIGVTLEDLTRIPMTLAVACGLHKTRAILGAVNSGTVNVLCTDAETASAVLQLAGEVQA